MITPNLLSISTDMAHIPVGIAVRFYPPETGKHTLVPEAMDRITLRHHRAAFVGCFSLRLKKNIDWDLFKRWKVNRSPSLTDQMARDFLAFIRNHYDLITTAPPSANRCPQRYCVYDLAKAISRTTGIPFVPAFSQKTDKVHHGRHASLNQSEPELLESWNVRNKSIFFVDDCITSGTTARLSYEALVALGNHVGGLIRVYAGG
ncbi:MAG: phosphoribosyltransferase [candidate division WOR-3 bacterium]